MLREVQQAAGCSIGHDAPAPVVDHAVQRVQALTLFKQTAAVPL